MADKRVIFERFDADKSRYHFPYPPVYREECTDYICFTDDGKVLSDSWQVVCVEDLATADLTAYLDKYSVKYELQQDEIQMGPLWDRDSPGSVCKGNIIRVPKLEELPEMAFDLTKLVPTADGDGRYLYRKNPVYHHGKYGGRPLLLTVGVPVSNQIGTIGRCLNGIKPLLDGLDSELIVIDTGSTDGTLDVCRRFGARIVSHPWHDDMSAVRNEGIYHARGLWYMSVDDDEWFEDVSDILDFFRRGTYRDYDSASYIQRNYIVSDGGRYEDFHTPRLARIVPALHFEGRIHDAIVNPDRRCLAMLPSVAHHYGFVNDNPEGAQRKFERNISILVYDVYEYPENLRYLFQMANEYNHMADRSTAVRLFSQTIALAVESGDKNVGRSCVPCIMADFFNMGDARLFSWADHLMKLFPLRPAGCAAIAWYQARLAAAQNQPAEHVLGYYGEYRKMVEEHWKNPVESKSDTFHGLALVEHDFYIMLAEAVAFWSDLDLGNEEEALEHLKNISLEIVGEKRAAVLESGFAAGDAIFGELCGRLTAVQWEEWSGEILDAFVAGMDRDDTCERQLARIPLVFGRVSVSAVIVWAQRHEGKNKGKPGRRLIAYALGLDVASASVQELCMASWMLKEEYVNRRGGPAGKDAGKEILRKYILATGVFAQRYYRRALLQDVESHAVPADIRAVYRMAVVLADGTACSENVTLLKEALAIFPPFHEGIRGILVELSAKV